MMSFKGVPKESSLDHFKNSRKLAHSLLGSKLSNFLIYDPIFTLIPKLFTESNKPKKHSSIDRNSQSIEKQWRIRKYIKFRTCTW